MLILIAIVSSYYQNLITDATLFELVAVWTFWGGIGIYLLCFKILPPEIAIINRKILEHRSNVTTMESFGESDASWR